MNKKNLTIIPIVACLLIAIAAIGTHLVNAKTYKAIPNSNDASTDKKEDSINDPILESEMLEYPLDENEQIDKDMLLGTWGPEYIYEPLDEEKIKASTELTEEQKQKLIKANQEAKIYFDQIKNINDANEKIFQEVMDGSDAEYDALDMLYEKHSDLRAKFEDEQNKLVEDSSFNGFEEDEITRIQNSKVLSEEEKSLLIADIKESKTYQDKIDARYAKYRSLSSENDKKYNEAYMAIEKIYADNQVNPETIPYDLIVPMTENFEDLENTGN